MPEEKKDVGQSQPVTTEEKDKNKTDSGSERSSGSSDMPKKGGFADSNI